jgi:hypothetical protein
MAEEQKNVVVPQEVKAEETVAPIATEPAAPATEVTTADKPVEETVKTDEAATEEKPAEEKKTEEKKEVKPIEEGQLGHKAQGASFPKNFIPSKEFFFFGTDSYEPKSLSNYLKNEKNTATYHSNVAWASETGKGLLFSGDKKAPTGIINLADASEPETEGPNKFTVTTKGNKHSFKAANTAERDNWVAQLKLKIAEAKEISSTVTESDTYKKTLDSFKPAPPAKKEEKTAAATPVAAAVVPTTTADETKEEAKTEEPAKTEEAAKEGEAVKEEPKAEKADKAESPKPSKSKRASFFGFFDKKDESKAEEKKEEKKEEPKAEDKVEDKVEKTEEGEAAKPTEEAIIATEEPAKPETETEVSKTEEPKTVEEPKAESPKEKASKRNSFFGGILSKKEKKASEPKTPDATEAPKEVEAPKTETNAPVIPPVEATTPLADAVNNDSSAPAAVDTTETTAAATEPKKDIKEKRKSSIPFLGKREKSPAPVEGEDKSSKSAFSKLRATIKGKSAPKGEEKTTEEATKEEAKDDTKEGETTETKTESALEPLTAEEAVVEEPKKAETGDAAEATKPETVAPTTTPAVTAAA